VLSEFFMNRKFVMFLIAGALIIECNQTITVFLNQIQYVRAGIDLKYMGYIYIIVTISGLLSAYTYQITKRLGDDLTIKLSFVLASVVCLIMAISYNPIASVLCIIVLRITSSVFGTISIDIQNKQIKTENRATMLSIYSCIMNVISVSMNLIFGRLADFNISYSMVAGATFCFIGFILYCIWKARYALIIENDN